MSRKPLCLSDVQRDRAVGTLLGLAAGDAFGVEGPEGTAVWTGTTARVIAVAEILSTGAGLCEQSELDYVVERWAWWSRNASDAGADESVRCLALAIPAALANLHPHADRAAVAVVGALCELIDASPDAADACALWSVAIRNAVLTGRADVRVGLRHIDTARHGVWESRIQEAERSKPSDFADAVGAVEALQAAWSAIVTTPVPEDDPAAGTFAADHLRLAVESAAEGGGALAAIAGGLVGAAYGASALPARWRLALKGWPGLNARGLVRLVDTIVDEGEPSDFDQNYESWRKQQAPQRHPRDDGLWIGSATSLTRLPKSIDAVVSLCRVADGHIPAGVRHLDVRLIDQVGANANLDFVINDTVRTIEALRADGAKVFLHGLRACDRLPAVAALYGARRAGIHVNQALAEIQAILPGAEPNREFLAALSRLQPSNEGER